MTVRPCHMTIRPNLERLLLSITAKSTVATRPHFFSARVQMRGSVTLVPEIAVTSYRRIGHAEVYTADAGLLAMRRAVS